MGEYQQIRVERPRRRRNTRWLLIYQEREGKKRVTNTGAVKVITVAGNNTKRVSLKPSWFP